MKATTSEPFLVDPAYDMKYYGTILSLDAFFGPIYLQENTVQNNYLRYESCDIAPKMSSNTFGGTDNYPIYGTKTDLQIRPLISITKHKHKFEMVQNNF